MIWEAPSKTFLVGEYSVLEHGEACILCTTPHFSLNSKNGERTASLQGPIESFLADYWPKNRTWDWSDPHHSMGGFGASSAAFALSLLITQGSDLDHRLAYQTFQSYHPHIKPSGADFLAQLSGGIAFVNTHTQQTESLGKWPFESLGFLIARTGFKCPTHEALNNFQPRNLSRLHLLTQLAVKAIKNNDPSSLVVTIKEHQEALTKAQYTHPDTLDHLAWINALDGVAAAKGCGAQGRDTLFILTHITQHESLKKTIHQRCPIVADHQQLAHPSQLVDA